MKNVNANRPHPTVCLDAGHYGKCNRSPVVPAYYESDMMWTLNNYLKAELEAYGIQVRQTRAEQGSDMELTARGRASKGCDLFISLHSNACGTESVDRTEAIHFVSRDGTDVDDRSKEIASMLAQTVYEVMDNNQRPKVYSKLASSDRNRDGVKNDNYYGVLHGAWMVGTPGLILEHSYHTNERAARWLLDEKNLQKLAQAEAKTIAEWFGISVPDKQPEPPTNPAPAPEQMYRIRTSWDNPASQIGAYRNLDGAKSACEEGYTVYDSNGNAVYCKTAAPSAPEPEVKIVGAKSFTKSVAGKYKIVSNLGFLRLRSGPSTKYPMIEQMPNGGTVHCYGYHTGDWLYVVSPSGAKGYCLKSYLRKK